MFNLDQVKIISRPGYFGRKRKEIEQQLAQFPGWIECWQVHTRIYTFEEAVMIYDDSYYHFLKDHPKLGLVESFGECYDSERNNIACGINHDIYSTPRHIQDVSVRRALLRLGTYFRKYRGSDEKLYDESELLHIRGEEITVTDGHRFWMGDISNKYASMYELRTGMHHYGGVDGDEFKSIEELEPREYYDFHVPQTNNYYACGFFHHNCGKSTLCEALSTNKNHVKALSTMRGFHSGHRDDSGTNKSVVFELKGKTLITKDADSMVKSPNWPQIMGEARDLFDRVSRTNYRNGMGMDSEGINMTELGCIPRLRPWALGLSRIGQVSCVGILCRPSQSKVS
jgi:hypothetical protein